MEKQECIIIGSGPAGYTAAIYAARYGKKPVLFSGMIQGGQLTQTTDVDNYPGFPQGIQGPDLVDAMLAQALRFGTVVKHQMIVSVDASDRPFKLTASDGAIYYSDSIIIATGASAKYLGIPNEQKYLGMGVSACATCDGYFYKGKEVIVVGGGDTALEEAIFLAHLARKVHLFVRKDHFRASAIIQEHVKRYDNIEIHYNTELVEVIGNEHFVEAAVVLDNQSNSQRQVDVDGIFIAIGHSPNTEVFTSLVNTDEVGYIQTIPGSTETNIPGIFACGDVQDTKYRQAITAAGSGCMAAIDVERFLNNRWSKNGIYCVETDANVLALEEYQVAENKGSIFDKMYQAEEYAYGIIPNSYFKDKIDSLIPGKILLAAEGEGRNAVYAASKGWEVYCFDISAYGKTKALKLAAQTGVKLNYELTEMENLTYALASFDVVALIYTPLLHSKLIKYLKPGGRLIFEGFSKEQTVINQKDPFAGGPREASQLFNYAQMKEAFQDLTARESYETQVFLDEGIYHQGLSSLLRFYGTK